MAPALSQQNQEGAEIALGKSAKAGKNASIAMWLSLAGLICLPVSLAGFLLGIFALVQFKSSPSQEGKNRAIAAVALGGSLLALAFLGFLASFINVDRVPDKKLSGVLLALPAVLLSSLGILATGTAVAVGVVIAKRKLEKLLLRAVENRAFKRPWLRPQNSQPRDSSPYFPIAASAGFLLIVALTALSPLLIAALLPLKQTITRIDYESTNLISMVVQIFALPLVVAIATLHYSGSGRRKLKYELALFYALFTWFCTLHVVTVLQIDNGILNASPLGAGIGIGVVLAFFLFLFGAAQLLAYRLSLRITRSKSFPLWFYRFQSRIWWFLALFYLPLFIVYFLFRYHFVKFISLRPILYFRSFELRSGSKTFGGIVAKAARRYGIVEALMTQRQRGSDLQV